MKRIGNLMEKICTFENALHAYKKANNCKRFRTEVIEFEQNREENLLRAVEDLKNGTYIPNRYKIFKVFEPKERTIMALPFYDRVIHHMIVTHIEPIFEKQFIFHSYACRRDKGAHKASKQLTRWLYNEEIVHGRRMYALKCDIHHYFQSIDHAALKNIVRKYIKDNELLIILDRIIDHNGCMADGVGIPVGNLTSQLFANVYLHEMDMFIKNELHAHYYMRYMDDFILLSDDPTELRKWWIQIDAFLRDSLKLELNPKTTIVCAKNGIDFVGYRHWNSVTKVRKASMKRMRKLFKRYKFGVLSKERFEMSFESRIASMKHADAYHLIEEYMEKKRQIESEVA